MSLTHSRAEQSSSPFLVSLKNVTNPNLLPGCSVLILSCFVPFFLLFLLPSSGCKEKAISAGNLLSEAAPDASVDEWKEMGVTITAAVRLYLVTSAESTAEVSVIAD